MIIVLISLTLFLQRTSGDSGVTQSPSVLWVQKGKPAEMNCSHTKGGSYYQMYWFRQQQGKPMERIVYITTSTSEFDKNKYSATKERAEDGNFTVKNVESDDSGLYFCAVDSSLRSFNRFWMFSFLPFFFNTDSAGSYNVSQTPADLLRKPDDSAKLQCSHKISSSNTILWYKQTKNRELQLMGYLTGSSPQYESGFSTKVNFSGSGRDNGILTIQKLTSDDSAVYFCAASTQ
ncbi:hypothetical protein NFI96_020426 [Prochilodus magdalenae]|nr:hypothetical protein NFI96_020426 [Prochilodus magdalenae]